MPIRARDVTKVPPKPSPPTTVELAEKFYDGIDQQLVPAWDERELEDSDNGGDHDRRYAGRRIMLPKDTHYAVMAHICKTYEKLGWRAQWDATELCMAPKHLIVQK